MVKEKGWSTCQIIEALMTGFIVAHKGRPRDPVDQSLTIQVFPQRVVKRVRRKFIEYVPETNRYECPPGHWIYDPKVPKGETWVEQPPEWDGEAKGFRYDEWMKLWRRRR